jgi:hypothetical protein
VFRENEIDIDILPELTEPHLGEARHAIGAPDTSAQGDLKFGGE